MDNHDLRIVTTKKIHTGNDDEPVEAVDPKWPPPSLRTSRIARVSRRIKKGSCALRLASTRSIFPSSTTMTILFHGSIDASNFFEASDKVWLASYHLTGVAQQWYYQMEHDGVLSWPRFADFVNMRFGPPIRSYPLGELTRLRRMGSVEAYQRQFLSLLCRTEPLSPLQQVQLFTVGLDNPLKTNVELQHTANLQTAMSLARAYELHL